MSRRGFGYRPSQVLVVNPSRPGFEQTRVPDRFRKPGRSTDHLFAEKKTTANPRAGRVSWWLWKEIPRDGFTAIAQDMVVKEPQTDYRVHRELG